MNQKTYYSEIHGILWRKEQRLCSMSQKNSVRVKCGVWRVAVHLCYIYRTQGG